MENYEYRIVVTTIDNLVRTFIAFAYIYDDFKLCMKLIEGITYEIAKEDITSVSISFL